MLLHPAPMLHRIPRDATGLQPLQHGGFRDDRPRTNAIMLQFSSADSAADSGAAEAQMIDELLDAEAARQLRCRRRC